MPQIQRNGQLVEVSQEEYDALNQPGQATTPAEGSYEQYAAAQAKAQAVEKLAAADGAVVGDTNISPSYQQGITDIRTSADTAAGANKDAYAARYSQEEQNLYTNAPTSREALESELSAPPPTVSPASVPVQKEYQQGTGGQVIGTLNTTNNIPDSTSGSIVGSPVRGLTSGGLTSGAATTPSYPTEDPQIPPPSTEGVEAFTPPPAPDAAFAQAQVAKEERWQQAAATNPEGIQDNGSVKTQLPDGTVETINRDGSYSVSGAEGTYRFNADGQVESYTSPTVNGLSVTTTTDGVKYTNYTNGPLTTSTIEKDGELISSDITYNTGATTLRATQVGDGEIVKTTSTVVDGDKVQGYTIEQAVQVGEGEIVSQTVQTETAEARAAAYEQATAENVKLREDLIAAKQQQETGIPLSATQTAALEEQAQATAEADTALAQAEQAVADQDPTVVAAGEDPQAFQPANDDPLPSLATTEVAPTAVDAADDPQAFEPIAEPVPIADVDFAPANVTQDAEVLDFEAAQEEAEFVPVADVDYSAAEVDPAVDPTTSQLVDDLPEAFVYTAADTPDGDPIVLAQADATATDVALVDITDSPDIIGEDDPAVPQPDVPPEGGFYGEPTPVGGNYTSVYDPETGTYGVVDIDTGEIVETGLSQQDATIAAQDLSLGDPQFPNDTEALADYAESDVVREPTDVDVAQAAFTEQGDGFYVLNEEAEPQPDEYGFVETEGGLFVQQEEIEAQIDQEQFEDALGAEELSASDIVTEPEDISLDQQYRDEPEGTILDLNTGERVTAGEAQAEAARIEAQRQNLRNQQSIREQRGNNVDTADWRVRLRLAPRATYLYNDTNYGPGILDPLLNSDGIIFPYTPTIQTVYKADYTDYKLTHSNYRGFFYQSSYVEDIQITGIFTAQDSVEANYLLAVIHFFRSATKMFYGQDPNRGAPPPLVYLSAYGAAQYVDAPCVISQFNYNLPADVDYIRAGAPNQDGTNLLKRRSRQDLPTNAFSAALQRLKNARPGGLPPGGEVKKPAPPTLGLGRPTYVPTRMEISIILHPMQSRQQVSQQFSVQEYAPGRLQPKGFW